MSRFRSRIISYRKYRWHCPPAAMRKSRQSLGIPKYLTKMDLHPDQWMHHRNHTHLFLVLPPRTTFQCQFTVPKLAAKTPRTVRRHPSIQRREPGHPDRYRSSLVRLGPGGRSGYRVPRVPLAMDPPLVQTQAVQVDIYIFELSGVLKRQRSKRCASLLVPDTKIHLHVRMWIHVVNLCCLFRIYVCFWSFK